MWLLVNLKVPVGFVLFFREMSLEKGERNADDWYLQFLDIEDDIAYNIKVCVHIRKNTEYSE